METEKGTKKKTMNLFLAFEQIVLLAEDSALSKDFYKSASKYIKYVSKKLSLTDRQSVMLAMFLDYSDCNAVHLGSFAKHLKCRTISLLRYVPDVEELERREFIIRSQDYTNAKCYRVSSDAIEAFKNNENFHPIELSNLTCPEFLSELEGIFDKIPSEVTKNKVCNLLEKNRQLDIVKRIKVLNLDEEMEVLLVYFIHLLVNDENDSIELRDIEKLYEERHRFREIKFDLHRGELPLQLLGLIEYGFTAGFANRETFRLSNQAKEMLFSGSEIYYNDNSNRPRIKAEEIVSKKLYYDEEVAKKVHELYNMLEDNNYKVIQERLVNSGFRSGVTCLFYGRPGTGKTETVLQIAKKTGRDVMQVDIAKIKSMWVGQSEKNIKSLFAQYRQRVKDSKITPILLFNEADAIIGTRRVGAEAAVDKLENSLLEIILQEMETLEGIMIATTNLERNIDKAFDRRFLIKIRFNQPGLCARKNIWESLVPELTDSEYNLLAKKYEFSGGQIENVARRFAINNILYGKNDEHMKTICDYCEGEKIVRERTKIGF